MNLRNQPRRVLTMRSKFLLKQDVSEIDRKWDESLSGLPGFETGMKIASLQLDGKVSWLHREEKACNKAGSVDGERWRSMTLKAPSGPSLRSLNERSVPVAQ